MPDIGTVGATPETTSKPGGGSAGDGDAPDLHERIRVLQERFRALRGPGGLPADKAFYDSLSGDT
jgi:hypothetical protein